MSHQREIRSFVKRDGRMTPSQQRALEQLWPRFGLQPEQLIERDLAELFGRVAPVTLEIGFGMGDSLAQMAATEPERNFLGIEVHRPGVGRLMSLLETRDIDNVRILCADAVPVLKDAIKPESIDRVQIFFPDPWPKKRHHKRRLLNPDFIALLRSRLQSGGLLHVATDWEDYAERVLELLNDADGLENLSTTGGAVPRPDWRPETRFEARGIRHGHAVWDLMFRRADQTL